MVARRIGTPLGAHRDRRECRRRSTPDTSRTGSSPSLLQLLQAPGPILLEQPRESAVGEEASARLADGTIVGLVVRVPDPLHRSPAAGTGLAVAPVDRHPDPERGHLLRKAVSAVLPQPHRPLAPPRHRGLMQTLDLIVV